MQTLNTKPLIENKPDSKQSAETMTGIFYTCYYATKIRVRGLEKVKYRLYKIKWNSFLKAISMIPMINAAVIKRIDGKCIQTGGSQHFCGIECPDGSWTCRHPDIDYTFLNDLPVTIIDMTDAEKS